MYDFEQANKELKELNIKAQLNIDSKSTQGWTCLHAACQYGNVALVQFFLDDLKCDPNIISKDGWAALHIASHLGFYEIVDVLLKCSRIDSNLIGNPERGTGLHCGVNAGHFKVVRMYLMNNADFEVKNADGKVPRDVCTDPNILGLFERFEKCKQEGKSNTVKVEDAKEVIKEEPGEEDEEEPNDLSKTAEVTYKYDLDGDKAEDEKDLSDKNISLQKTSSSSRDTKESLILESELNPSLFEKEEYLKRVIAILDEFKDNAKM